MAKHAPFFEEFLADLEKCVSSARDADTAEANAPLYGLSGTVDREDNTTEEVVDLLNELFVS